jgi:anti-anti-sigma regulatory factor
MVTAVRYEITSMSGADDVAALIYACRRAMETGQHLYLNLRNSSRIYPNGAVPMAVALQYFKSIGLVISTSDACEAVTRTDFLNPRRATSNALESNNVKNVVWRYSNEREANALCNSFVNQLEETVECGPGVLDALNWCLFEVMDNVFQHSHAECGYAMLQIHYAKKHCAVAVADDGIGIYQSFRDANVYSSRDEYEAIKLAIQEKVTSKTKNMGNGLYGLMRVVGLNSGEMQIRSGRGYLSYKNARLSGDYKQSRPVLDPVGHRGTLVDWQLDVSKQVSLTQALGVAQPNLRLEAIEDGEGEHRLFVSQFEEGLGTRRSAEQIRMRLLNFLNDGVPRLVLDFSDINIISSSFADEVLGKLALQMGLVQFINRFRLDNMSETIEAIINRAVQQRVAEGDSNHPGSARS